MEGTHNAHPREQWPGYGPLKSGKAVSHHASSGVDWGNLEGQPGEYEGPGWFAKERFFGWRAYLSPKKAR